MTDRPRRRWHIAVFLAPAVLVYTAIMLVASPSITNQSLVLPIAFIAASRRWVYLSFVLLASINLFTGNGTPDFHFIRPFVTRDIGYVGAGTMEFLLAEDGRLRFMEMNTRLQVEHGVSEMLMDVDLVTAQLRIAAGARLELSQEQLKPRGHVIECRINAEDPARGFAPTPGKVTRFGPPLTPEGARGDIRVDTHAEPGYVVGPHYDSLLAKLLVRGADREDARKKMIEALDAFVIEGVSTTIPFHRAVLSSEAFSRGEYFAGELPGFTAPSETVAGEATSP